tara:strand:+ start:791 stop:964 length:174 start_codon:yes stop_codon:yes gene_type:complete
MMESLFESMVIVVTLISFSATLFLIGTVLPDKLQTGEINRKISDLVFDKSERSGREF